MGGGAGGKWVDQEGYTEGFLPPCPCWGHSPGSGFQGVGSRWERTSLQGVEHHSLGVAVSACVWGRVRGQVRPGTFTDGGGLLILESRFGLPALGAAALV